MADQATPESAAAPDAVPDTFARESGNITIGATAPGPDGPVNDWRAGIEDAGARQYAGRFETPGEVATNAFHLRQKLSGTIRVPGPGADADEIANFKKAVGIPDTPDGYEIKLPDDVHPALALDKDGEKRLAEFRTRMHEAGAPGPAVQAAIDAYYDLMKDSIAGMTEAGSGHVETVDSALRKNWGADYDRNRQIAEHAAASLGGQGFVDFITTAKTDGVALRDHPEFLHAFAKIGHSMGEDTMHSGNSGTNANDKDGTQANIERLQVEKFEAYDKGDMALANRLDREQRDLYALLYPGNAIGPNQA